MKLKNIIILLIFAMVIAGLSGDMSAYQQLSGSVPITSQGAVPFTPKALLDDFSKSTSINLWGGTTSTVAKTGTSATITASYLSNVAVPLSNSGRCLQLTYDVTPTNSWAAYVTSLGGASISGYNYLSFWVKGAAGGEYFKIELHDASYDYTKPEGYNNDHRAEIYVTDYLDGGVSAGWKKVVIPLDAFANINDRTAMKELVITFENKQSSDNGSPQSGTIYINNISFGKQFLGFVRIDHFGDKVSKNALGGNCNIVSETTTPHGSYTYTNNSAYYVDYAYGLWYYFQDVWDRTTPVVDHRWVAYVNTVGGGDTGSVPQPRNFSAYSNFTFYCKSGDPYVTTLKVELHCPTYANNYFHFFTRKNGQNPIGTTWTKYTIPLANFTASGWNGNVTSVISSGGISSLGEIVFTRDGWVSSYGDWDGGIYSGAFFIDKVQFEASGYAGPDTTAPAAPAAPTYVPGGTITLSCTASSAATDPSMECVCFQVNIGGTWKTIGYDYDTANSTYTVQWDTSSLPHPFLYGVRAVAMDAAGNTAVSPTTSVGG